MLHDSLPSVCVSVCISPIVARQQLGKKHYHGNKYTHNRRNVGYITFYDIRIITRKVGNMFFPELLVTAVDVVFQMERYGNPNGTNYKLDHTTYSNTFSFHPCAFSSRAML
jgi:hypothetical protein